MAERNPKRAPVGQYQPLHLAAATTAPTPIGQPVRTTSSTAVAAPGSATITPASMANIQVGMILTISEGTGTAENVKVTAVTATTFTATFANTHSSTYNITSKYGIWLGTVIINQVGTGMTLKLYNGHPSVTGITTPGYGTMALVTPVAGASLLYHLSADSGLYYEYTGTTPGDVTLGWDVQAS